MEQLQHPQQQEVYDFSTVKAAVSAVDPASSMLIQLTTWATLLAQVLDNQPPTLSPTDEVVFAGIAKRVISIVAGFDRPMMLARFQGYARLTLTDEAYIEIVGQQIIYDFDQLTQFVNQDNGDLLDEIVCYRDLVLAGETLPQGYQYSPEFIAVTNRMAGDLSHRPHFLGRLQGYLLVLGPPEADDDTPDAWLDDGDDDDDGVAAVIAPVDDGDDASGGLPANLLAPPPTV